MRIAIIAENIRIALNALMANKTRSALTMLGITIGVASVILLTSVGAAVEDFIIGEFSSFGTNLLSVFGKISNDIYETAGMSPDENIELFVPMTDEDFEALLNPMNTPDAAIIAADVVVNDPIEYKDEEYSDAMIVGVTANYTDAFDFTVSLGEKITEEHSESASRVAVIGPDVVEDIFDGAYPLGESIRIAGVRFEIIGVFDEIESALNPEINNIVVLPMTTVQRRIIGTQTVSGGYPITEIVLQAKDADSVDALVEQTRDTIRDVRGLDDDEQDTFVVFSQNSLLETLETTTRLLTLFLGVIAGISLLVGGIGIMNIMLVTVTERTREIGVRKAMGAQRSDILTQFLIESVTLALVGGTIGTLIAITLSMLTSALVPNLDVSVSFGSIALAAGISLAVGAFFGVYPANRAANLNPIDALRYE